MCSVKGIHPKLWSLWKGIVYCMWRVLLHVQIYEVYMFWTCSCIPLLHTFASIGCVKIDDLGFLHRASPNPLMIAAIRSLCYRDNVPVSVSLGQFWCWGWKLHHGETLVRSNSWIGCVQSRIKIRWSTWTLSLKGFVASAGNIFVTFHVASCYEFTACLQIVKRKQVIKWEIGSRTPVLMR